MAVLLALQGISEALKALLTLAGVSLEQDDEDSHHV
jgi:TRAP-type mannitol/chloroaromatic compound transport system permease small subunit